jgi:hypothetical protein
LFQRIPEFVRPGPGSPLPPDLACVEYVSGRPVAVVKSPGLGVKNVLRSGARLRPKAFARQLFRRVAIRKEQWAAISLDFSKSCALSDRCSVAAVNREDHRPFGK